MNKKFSTLVAGILLATSFGAIAQIAPTGDFAKYVTANKPTVGMPTIKSGYFQLAVGSAIDENVLAMKQTSAGKYELSVVTGATTVEVRNTLWKAIITGNAEAGYSYQLQNLGTGELLAVNTDEAIPVDMSGATVSWPTLTTSSVTPMGSAVSVWKWVAAPDPVDGFKIGHAANLTSAFGANNDSVVTLVANTAVANDVKIAAVKYALKNIPSIPPASDHRIKAVPAYPQAFTLGVDDLNSLLWKQNPAADDSKAEFVFHPNVINDETNVFGNLFTDNEYKAVPAVGFPAAVDVATNPFNGVSAYEDLYDAEIAYYQLGQEKAFIEKLYPVVLDNQNKVDATKLAALNAAIKVITDANTAIGALTTPAKIAEHIEKTLVFSTAEADADQVKAVKDAAIAYVLGAHGKIAADALTEAKGISDATTTTAITKKINDFISTNMTAGVAKTAIEAAVKTAYTDKLKDDAALATAITTAKTALTTATSGYYAKGVADNKWVSLMLEEGDKPENNTYLSVARDFVTKTQNERERPLRFTTGKFSDFGYTADPKARLDLNGRYNFQFTYFPNADSLVIRTGGWAKKNENQGNDWGAMNTTDNPELGVAAASPSATAPTAKGTENNIVKLIYLANNHSEITVGSSDYYIGAAPNTINTRISLKKIDDEYVKTTLESGVYFFNLFSEKEANKAINGKYMIADFAGQDLEWATEETSKVFEGAVQDYGHMPRTQWVVSQNTGAAGIQTVNIYNREYPNFKVENVQLYKGGDGKVFALGYNNLLASANDTLSYVLATTAKPNAGIATSETLGYKALDYDALIENIFSLKYFNGLDAGNFVEVSKDAAMAINPKTETADAMKFVFEPVLKNNAPEKNPFGLTAKVANVKNLYRIAYKVKLYNPGKEDLYLQANDKDGYELISETASEKGTEFFFKENNMLDVDGDTTCYYALVEKDLSTVSGVKHPSLILSVEDIDTENSIATFAFDEGLKPLYRRLGTIDKDFNDMTVDTAKFYMANEPTRFLYENSANRTAENGSEIAKDSLNFLGVINKADRPENSMLPIFIDTAYVRNETSMPQYMLALGAEFVAGKDAEPCPLDHNHGFDKDGKPLDKWTCSHATPGTKGYITGRYLVALDDSSAVAPIKYQDKFRLAFVDAKHIEDTLVIANSKYTGSKKLAGKDSIMLNNDKVLSAATFAFRIVDGSENGDFYIETVKNAEKQPQYVRVHNGVPVLVDNIAEAAQFNLNKTSEDPVANETIGTTSVSVISSNGAIIIKGAAGKKVTISNVLGQTIANTVLSSDEATISAPAGVVVVAVEGEAAVKAIVK